MGTNLYDLGVVGAFSEMIHAGVKQLALSAPMSPSEMDRFEADAKKISEKFDVEVYREPDLVITSLFPEDVAAGKEVLLLYTGNTPKEPKSVALALLTAHLDEWYKYLKSLQVPMRITAYYLTTLKTKPCSENYYFSYCFLPFPH